jgi:hypothetical protein
MEAQLEGKFINLFWGLLTHTTAASMFLLILVLPLQRLSLWALPAWSTKSAFIQLSLVMSGPLLMLDFSIQQTMGPLSLKSGVGVPLDTTLVSILAKHNFRTVTDSFKPLELD